MNLPPAQAALELLERRKVRSSFTAWCRLCGYEPAKHHLIIIKELETLVDNLLKALVRGHEIPEEPLRLMVMTPPGSAKSTYISKLFPPWFEAQSERFEKALKAAGKQFEPLGILSCSHSADLAVTFGRAARNLILANERWLGYGLNQDSRAADQWSLTNKGYYQAAGVGAGISGRRMHLGSIDDYCGSEQDATSKLFNDNTWIWYENDFISRLQPIAARLIIANHRNEDDLCGRIMAKEAAKWRIVRLRLVIETQEQADADPLGRKVGEYLWPEYFTKEQVDERMANPRASGLQQQEPSPEKGGFFQAEWFDNHLYKSLAEIPAAARAYAASDHAVSEKQTADNTCMGIGMWADGRLWIHPDVVWDRIGSKRAVDEMLRMIKLHKPLYWWAEKGHISKSIGPFLQDRMMDEHVFACIVEVTPATDKMTRAQSFQGMMSMGVVMWPSFAPWFQRARREMLLFPNGKHDDFVDFVAHLGNGVHQMVGKIKRREQVSEVPPNFRLTPRILKETERREKRRLVMADR